MADTVWLCANEECPSNNFYAANEASHFQVEMHGSQRREVISREVPQDWTAGLTEDISAFH